MPLHRVSRFAVQVTDRLQKKGYKAYIVGGGVRDLLLGKRPKDFDVATDATPEQVCDVFQRSRLIGRRFRIAHVIFGREIIEVATFRGPGNNDGTAHHAQNGRILRDNVFGTLEQDAQRRDFTINALYLDPSDGSVRDYVGGYEDLNNGVLKLIGDPATRYQEDPVRLLRAVRFAAKLGLELEENAAEPIKKLGKLLREVPPARLFDELNKLFMSGHAQASFAGLQHYDLVHWLIPQHGKAGDETGEIMLQRALANTDQRVRQRLPITPAFFYAVVLWPGFVRTLVKLEDRSVLPHQAQIDAGEAVILEQIQVVSIPRRFSAMTREIWSLQPRFVNQHGKRAARLLEQRRFRAAYDFLLLRAEEDPGLQAQVEFWTRIQELSPDDRTALLFRRRNSSGRRKAGKSRRQPAKKPE